MNILSADLFELYVFLNKNLSQGNKWVVYNRILVFQSKDRLHCFRYYIQARQFAQSARSLCNCSEILNMRPLFHTVTSILLLKNPPAFVNTNHYINLNNYKIMNVQNLEFLQSNLKYFGFGDKLNEELEKNMKAQKPEFQLKLKVPRFNSKVDYTLHFKKSEQTEMYFFNRFDASLQSQEHGKDKNQAFFINKGSGVTAKEAFNLLEGRSVYKNLLSKEGEKYSAWLKLDFENSDEKGNFKMKQFNTKYGYDLDRTLANYPIKELSDPEQKKQLLQSLEKGNLQQVTMKQGEKEGKYYIEAIPQFKNINVYDQKMHPVRRQNLQTFGQSESSNQKEEKKQGQKKDEGEQPVKKQTRKRKLSA